MRKVFCTIITSDYIPFARTLFQSLSKFEKDLDTISLIVDGEPFQQFDEFQTLIPQDLSEPTLVKDILKKYSQDSNPLRWSLKSVLMIHLLKSGKYDQVFFVDSDLYFYSDIKFLYEELGEHSFLLSPHWGCMNPVKSELYFNRLMTDGLYNAGFLGATKMGLNTLYWWANMCLYACEKDKNRGLHDDQAYLNIFPLLSPDSKIITHRGCNVAEWNRFENLRSLDLKGNLILNGKYPVVFIHFSNLGYLVEQDPLLVPYLNDYEDQLKANGLTINLISAAKSFAQRNRLKSLNFSQRVLRKLIGNRRFSNFMGWNNLNE